MTSSAKLDEMLNFQKSASNKTSLGYDHSLSSCSTSSNALNRVIFVPPDNNDNSEVTDSKTKNVSKDKSNKGKSILGEVGKKETKQNNHCSTNKKSLPKKPTFVTIVEHLGILIQIAISGQPLNKAIVCHLLGTKINSNFLQPILANFLRHSYFSRTLMVSTLLLIHLNNGSCKRKDPYLGLPSERKKFQAISSLF